MDVYADLLFLINFSMDFLCMFLSVKLLHLRQHKGRMLLAAILGGLYSVVSLLVSVREWIALTLDIGMCLVMCAVCSAGKGVRFSRLLLLCGTYFGISALMGGGMTALYNLLNKLDLPLGDVQGDGISAWMFLLLAAAAAMAAAFGGRLFSRQTTHHTCTVHVRLADAAWELTGLCDSGNLLCDPISGTPVIVADREVWLAQLPDELRCAVESDGKHLDMAGQERRLRIIPMQTAQGNSLTVALLPDEIRIEEQNGKSRAVHALIAPSGQALPGDFHAVVPATLLR
ncbi:MAG: sigma-E processing peptidase SpoIIGA [Clostridia bacterium]|nr:sigma-E processing peptidase SpoIIGA [Clostridia bacterium]